MKSNDSHIGVGLERKIKNERYPKTSSFLKRKRQKHFLYNVEKFFKFSKVLVQIFKNTFSLYYIIYRSSKVFSRKNGI